MNATPTLTRSEHLGTPRFFGRCSTLKKNACRINMAAIGERKAREMIDKTAVFTVIYESAQANTPEEKAAVLKERFIDRKVVVIGACSAAEELAALKNYVLTSMGL